MLAGTRERLDWLKMAKARGRYLGMQLELISVDEAAELFPLLNKKHFVGALYDPIEGHVDPYGVTQAYAKAAQIGGAEIVRQNRVIDLRQRADGSWDVITEKGNVHAEHVVNAGGLWAREVGRMVGTGTADPRHGAPVPDHRGPAGAEGPQGAAALHRLRGRDLHAPGARRHAARAPTSAPACPGRRGRRPGTSARACCRTTWSALRRVWRSASSISRPWAKRASARSSTAPSPSPPTAIRWSARSGA